LQDQDDLVVVFDVGSSIEITLAAIIPSPIDLTRSKYDIGGKGFQSGGFVSGTLSPAHSVLSLQATGPGEAPVCREPKAPGCAPQETSCLIPAHWVDSPSGRTTHVTVPVSEGMEFYGLRTP
jgi:hypothetical protein